MLSFKEKAYKFYEIYNSELRSWIKQGANAEEKRAFLEKSKLTAERCKRVNELYCRVKKMLDDFQATKQCVDVAIGLRSAASFMEDQDSENLLREERIRQLRDEILVLDQASKRFNSTAPQS